MRLRPKRMCKNCKHYEEVCFDQDVNLEGCCDLHKYNIKIREKDVFVFSLLLNTSISIIGTLNIIFGGPSVIFGESTYIPLILITLFYVFVIILHFKTFIYIQEFEPETIDLTKVENIENEKK